MWGQYVAMDQTLSHYLNEKANAEGIQETQDSRHKTQDARQGEKGSSSRSRLKSGIQLESGVLGLESTDESEVSSLKSVNTFANLGVDGTHPAAILGLVRYYGKAVSSKGVILHLNFLWMSSEKHDLSGEEEFRFNHPKLVPQFIPDLACYRPSFAQKIGVVMERSIPFFNWISHIKTNYFENMDVQDWTIQNPYKNPLKAITLKVPAPENRPKSKPVSWTERGMKEQDFPWVQVEESFQWDSFKKAIKILEARRNKVFVILGPFNTYILTEESLNRYNIMKGKMEKWLEEEGVSYRSIPELPSEYYADASHPLREGYAQIAQELSETESFQKWMENLQNGD